MSACSPEPKAALAVERDQEGRYFLLTLLCEGQYSTSYSVVGVSGSDDVDGWDISNFDANSLDRVEIFSAPDGWAVQQPSVHRLQAGHAYMAFAYFNIGRPEGAELIFSMDDVSGLEEGDVLVKDGSGVEVMNRDKFIENLQRQCR
jgi:hypothetical protein